MRGCGGGEWAGPLDTVRHCIKGRPPMVLFTLVLLLFAFAFVGLMFYVDWLDASPESQKWDQFVGKLESLGFCVEDDQMDPLEYGVPSAHEQNFSVNLNMRVKPTRQLVERNLTVAQAMLNASDLGFHDTAPEVAMLVSLTPSQTPEELDCGPEPGSLCMETVIGVCATFINLTSYFPDRPQFPKTCSAPHTSHRPTQRFHMEAAPLLSWPRRRLCGSQTSLRVDSRAPIDSDGAPLWNLRRRSDGMNLGELSSLHLLYTSYFVFFMALTLLVYSAYKASRAAASGVGLDKGVYTAAGGSSGKPTIF